MAIKRGYFINMGELVLYVTGKFPNESVPSKVLVTGVGEAVREIGRGTTKTKS